MGADAARLDGHPHARGPGGEDAAAAAAVPPGRHEDRLDDAGGGALSDESEPESSAREDDAGDGALSDESEPKTIASEEYAALPEAGVRVQFPDGEFGQVVGAERSGDFLQFRVLLSCGDDLPLHPDEVAAFRTDLSAVEADAGSRGWEGLAQP